jgi:uncharacterized protein (TIGR03083 family)
MTSQLPAETYSIAEILDAWEGSAHAVNELGKRLTPEQWEQPTECPGWSTGDIVRHCCWVEGMLAGRPMPEGELDAERFPHVQNPFQQMTELGVEVRRGDAQADVCIELDGLIDVRLAQLMAIEPLALDTEVMGLMGRPVPLHSMLRTRIFDLWTHEQDIRRAVGLPANLASPGGQVTAVQLARATGFVLARNVEAPPGTSLRISVTGPIAFERWAAVDDDARGVDLDSPQGDAEATISLTTDWETYARLGAGRLDVQDAAVQERVAIGGDPELAGRLLEALAITP